MKRYLCTVAAGLVLAFVSTGTATATILPLPTQSGTQETDLGDQTVDKQQNDADVTQKQGNGNLNVSPAIAILGDAKTTNAQGNGNTATADVDQSNSVEQSQSSYQRQAVDQNGAGCCGQSQTAEQKADGGDQTVGKQRNDADVDQYQGNGNVNVSPAIAILGNAETTNHQGNHNSADAQVTQSNDATQSSKQKQYAGQQGGGCCEPAHGCNGTHDCKPTHHCKPTNPCRSKTDHTWWEKKRCCGGSRSQTAEQKTSSGDQTVGKQRNDADVTQKQGNWNGSVAPALSLGGYGHGSCNSSCEKSRHLHGAGASTTNKQGNGNEAAAVVDQRNAVDQSQGSYQHQVIDTCKGLVYR